jgi:hypothetical protein
VNRAGFAAGLTISFTLAGAAALGLLALLVALIHPGVSALGALPGLVNQQSQTAKTIAFVITFVVLLPLGLVAGARLADAVAAGPNGRSLPAYAVLLAGSLAVLLIVIRLSGGLPWGDGVKGILAGGLVWTLFGLALTWRVAFGRRWAALERVQRTFPLPLALLGLLVFGVLLCVTRGSSLHALPLAAGAAVTGAVVLAYGRFAGRPLRPRGRRWLVVDLVVVALLLFAIPDVIVFKNPVGIPNFLFDPGIVQFQQDWLLGPANQLLGGGALLVGDPISQYGVGVLYLLAGWFHLAPIGYGTFGFLDGLLTALFYIAGYLVLRVAGVSRALATATIGLAVVTLLYSLRYYLGQLPEEGPLRFGLPMLVLLSLVTATARPRMVTVGRVVALVGLGASAAWALEAFAYTLATYLALLSAQAWLGVPGERARWLARQVGLGVAACVAAHILFALATLAGSGQLPDWAEYLAYVREFLFGGTAGSITYGFSNWSAGLAVDASALLSAAGVILLALRRRDLITARPAILVALAGSSAYTIVLLSYTDNRSSTYLLNYVALPLVLAAGLWLALLLSSPSGLTVARRRAALIAAGAVAVLMVSAAWPGIGTHFDRTALARAYPSGGLTSALDRLWDPPPIDPRARTGIRLLDRYVPGRRSIILFPTLPDLGTEILIRSHRANLLPIGDPKADGLVPSVWMPRIHRALRKIRAGQLILTDRLAFKVMADLRRSSAGLAHGAIDGGGIEVESILHQLDLRFRIVPVHRGPAGLLVARLSPR